MLGSSGWADRCWHISAVLLPEGGQQESTCATHADLCNAYTHPLTLASRCDPGMLAGVPLPKRVRLSHLRGPEGFLEELHHGKVEFRELAMWERFLAEQKSWVLHVPVTAGSAETFMPWSKSPRGRSGSFERRGQAKARQHPEKSSI